MDTTQFNWVQPAVRDCLPVFSPPAKRVGWACRCGQAEMPRVVLLSVPYALKALDAETIGGKPASSFMLAPQAGSKSAAPAKLPPGTIAGSGTADYVPMFTGTTTIGNSKIYQNASGDIGVNTTSPVANLDVKGKTDVRDTLTLFPKASHPALVRGG